jgi:D-alanyl-D-alanine carboxypeptidase
MLARHLYLDFPHEYGYFATTSFTYRGTTYGNHNHLMSSFAGMDGIKTGFIRASGFNLAASAVRNGHRLIGVVMGGVSAHARDMKMADLLNAAFDGRPSPDIMVASNETKSGSNRALHVIARHAVGTLAKLSPISKAEAATPSHWMIQVGAFSGHAAAIKAANTARAHAPAARGKPVVVVASHLGRKTVYAARIADLTPDQAKQACESLQHAHKACTVLGPSQLAAQKAGGSTPQARS